MPVVDLLKVTNFSLLIVGLKSSSNITIGVPHHTPGGTPNMRCSEHPDGDENAGYIGNYLSEKFNCSFVCACNYFLDPNKTANTDYSVAIAKSNPGYLIEIHAHGKKKTENDVEISCGSKEKETDAIKLKTELENLIKKNNKFECLKRIRIEAEFSKIHFKATESSTIRDERWKSYHIELSPELRIDCKNRELPRIGYEFAEMLYQAIMKVCKDLT